MVHRAYRHADGGRRVLAGERSEPGHALDHGVICGSVGSTRGQPRLGPIVDQLQLVQAGVGPVGPQ